MKMSFKTIFFGGLAVFFAVVIVVVFIPDLLWNPPVTTIAHPYDEVQKQGRILFYSNGCNYCHTQYVRPEDNAMGVESQGGNYVYDNPMILGSERTGPDLSYLGRKRSLQWDLDHLKHPRKLSPLSIMPNWYFLSDADLTAIVTYLWSLGDRVAQNRMILPIPDYAGQTDPIEFPAVLPKTGDTPQGWDTWVEAQLQEGKETFVKNCMTCHGCAGNGLGTYGGTLTVTPVNFKQDPFRNMPDDQWFWHVSEGVQGTVMPPWKESLTVDQRWKVIRFVQQLFARPIERDPNEGDPNGIYVGVTNPLPQNQATLEQGKTIFTRECSVCHGLEGRGDGPYGAGLLPLPADFGSGNYGTIASPVYEDADFYWRISEGLPWASMQTWKLQYNESDRWALTYYIRVNLAQTLPRPAAETQPQPPDIYLSQTMPDTASFESGKVLYLSTCAMCHGFAGDGTGTTGSYLDVQPKTLGKATTANFTDGDYFSKITFGSWNSAMPIFAEIMPESQRWDIIKFIQLTFRDGTGRQTTSYYGNGEIATNFMTLSQDDWLAEGHIVSSSDGQTAYETYCATCHGDTGQGDGPGIGSLADGGPAPFPANMDPTYAFWRTWSGISETSMYPFNWLLSETDIFNIYAYLPSLLTPAAPTK